MRGVVCNKKRHYPFGMLMAVLTAIVFMLLPQSCRTSDGAGVTTASRKVSSADKSSSALQNKKTSLSRLPAAERRRIDYLYMEAAKQKMAENYAAVYDICRHLVQIAPDMAELHYDLGICELLLGKDSTAIFRLNKASELDPSNAHYKEVISSYFLNRGEYSKALPALEDLSRLEPSRSDVLARLVQLYRAAGQTENAIRALDRIETLEGVIPSVAYQKFQLYQSLKKSDEAFECLEALCREYPNELSYRLTIGDQMLESGRTGEAKKIYEEVEALEPKNKGLQLSWLEFYRATGQDALFHAKRDSMLFGENTDEEIRLALLRDYISAEATQDSIGRQHINDTFKRLSADYPNSLDLHQLHAAYLATYEKGNDSVFVDVMEHIITLDPTNTQAVFYLIQYYGTHKKFNQLEALCRRAVINHPEELVCHYYLGVACWQLEKKEDALKAFQDGIVQKTSESRPAMVADLFSLMGDVLHELGREKESYAAYDSCLTYQDDHVGCLNNYAYYLSLKEQNLDKAEEMSYRTVRISPENKTYLDTYAWVLFVKGRYIEAKAYMDKVVPPDSSDEALLSDASLSGAVFEHAGDIAAQNGLAEQAVRFWKLASKAGGEGLSAALPKKIKLKKYVK
ncbi:MAG: tetratricopeptide repeat protein [Bacteroidaceae bacterium]|nr:tetratricopeptide repeat protein [Bacteroidaceae bacterium]